MNTCLLLAAIAALLILRLPSLALASWLHAGYHSVFIVDAFDSWERNGR